MTRIEQILRCSKPLFEEHAGDDDFAYTFAGSIFAASFRERFFLITARHVLDRMDPVAARTWVNGRSLALSHVLRPDAWEEPYGDLAMLELDISTLDDKDREELWPIVLDAQLNYSLRTLVENSRLVVKGYPSELMQLDFAPPQKITPKGYLTDAKYVRESEPGLHLVHYYPGPRPVKSHDGLSGAPWLVDDRRTNEWQHKLAGVHVRGNMEIGRFIGADVLVGMLLTQTKRV